MRIARAGLVLGFMLGACGNGSISFSELPDEFAKSTCSRLYACCNDAEAQQLGALLGFTDEASCVTKLRDGFADDQAGVQARIDMGEVVYSGEAAADCLDAADSASCTDTSADTSACGRIFTGKVTNGGACEDDYACRSGYCDETTLPAVCGDIPGAGQACNDRCQGGLRCVDDVCIEPKALGASCTSGDECASGRCQTTCVANTVCDGNDTN